MSLDRHFTTTAERTAYAVLDGDLGVQFQDYQDGKVYEAVAKGAGSANWRSLSDISGAAVAAAQADATSALANAATAQTTANAALPKAGGTMTGAITLTNTAAAASLVATTTIDTPATTYTAHVASTDPAGFIKITVGGQARYIPFFT
jgi:hypothetical protein